MREPKPVFRMPREIIIATPINQISGLEKLLKASFIASAGFSAVTPVIATSIIAIIERAPIGIALPIIAAITPTNIANKCHACGVTPSGTGMTNQISKAKPSAIAVGKGLKPKFCSILRTPTLRVVRQIYW